MNPSVGARKWFYALMVVTVAVATAAGASGCKAKGSAEPKGTVSSKAAVAQTKTAASSGWTAVSVIDGSIYFGKLVDTDHPDILLLDDAYFVTKGSDVADSNTLRRFGNEVHRPLSAVEFPRSSVLFSQSLLASSPAVAAIQAFEKKEPSKASSPVSVVAGSPYAVFLRDGQVFFGTVTLGDGSMTLSGAHYLSFKDQQTAELGQIESLDDVTLVPQARSAIAPTGAMDIPLTSVLYFQALAKDSPVVKALQKK